MLYKFTNEDWALAETVARGFEATAKKSGYKSCNKNDEERARYNVIGQLGEIAVARVAGAIYRGDRDAPRDGEPGDVGFVEVHSSPGRRRPLILTKSDHEKKRFRPYLHVDIDMGRRTAWLSGWDLADRAFDNGERRQSRFSTTCWYVPPEKLRPPEDLIWLLGRWQAYTAAVGREPDMPEFAWVCTKKELLREVDTLLAVYSPSILANAVDQHARRLAALSKEPPP